MASKTNLVSFFKQVRSEGSKVTWPTRKETFVSTVFVLVMVFIMTLFLFFVDRLVEFGIWNVLKLF